MSGLLIAWDIDGTLVQASVKGSAHATFANATSFVLDRPVSVDFRMHGMTDIQIVNEILTKQNVPLSRGPEVLAKLDEFTLHSLDDEYKVTPAPGAYDVLSYTLSKGYTNVLLTGNTKIRAIAKIRHAGYAMDEFNWELSAFGSETTRRTELAQRINQVAASLGIPAVIVGDTPYDARAAKEAYIPFCGVTTGAYTRQDLEKERSSIVIDDFIVGRDVFIQLLSDLAN
jgi:phosphoglycolate phosphatase